MNSQHSSGQTSSDVRQCQGPGCFKSKESHGIKLRQCSRCSSALYCSRECQRAAWPTHRVQCSTGAAFLAAIRALESEGSTRLGDDLEEWSSIHGSLLAQSVIDCLDLRSQPELRQRKLMVVAVTYEPHSPSMRTRFRVEVASAVLYDELLQEYSGLSGIREERGVLEAEQIRTGALGTAMCLLMSDATANLGVEVVQTVPVHFAQETLVGERNIAWERRLMDETQINAMV